EVEAGSEFEVGPFRFTTALLPHWVPNSGMRISADGSVLCYTGDTGPSEDIEVLARDADLLVIEASWQDRDLERRPQPFHLPARSGTSSGTGSGPRGRCCARWAGRGCWSPRRTSPASPGSRWGAGADG